MKSRVAAGALLLLLANSLTAHAQSRAEELVRLVQRDAFTIANCQEAGCKAVIAWRDRCVTEPKPPADCPADGVRILQETREKLAAIAESPTQLAKAAASLVNVLALPRPLTAGATTDFKEFQREMDSVLDKQALWRIQPPARLEIDATVIDLDKVLAADCAGGQAVCDRVFGQAKEVATYAARVSYVLTYFQRLTDGGLTDYFTALDKKWGNYFEATRDQWPWELWINSRRFRDEGLYGFREPPSSQLIVLHPAVGYEYADGKFEESLQIELIGYYRWRWAGEGAVTQARGGSVTLNLSGRDGSKNVGIGFLYHLEKGTSLGLASRKEDGGGRLTTIVFSYDLGKTVQEKLGTLEEFVEKHK